MRKSICKVCTYLGQTLFINYNLHNILSASALISSSSAVPVKFRIHYILIQFKAVFGRYFLEKKVSCVAVP